MKPEKNSPLTDPRFNAAPELVAVIDIGASSLRMQISEIDRSNHQIRNLESFSQAVSVGKDSFTKHHITKKTTESCVRVLKIYRSKLIEYGITNHENVRVIATSGVREATIEFAVNDDQDASHSREVCIRGMEGIIRHIKREHPSTDLAVTYFVNPPMLETWQQGKIPLSVAAHEHVLQHYGVSSVVLAKEIADRITAGSFTWKEYGGTHPAPAGNQIAANLVQDLLNTAWHLNRNLGIDENPESKSIGTAKALPKSIDRNSYHSGQLTEITTAKTDDNWQIGIPNWKNFRGSMRSRFENLSFLHASTVDSEISLDFEGSAIGLFILGGA